MDMVSLQALFNPWLSFLKGRQRLVADREMNENEAKKNSNNKSPRIHVNCEVQGEPARVLLELKDRGLVLSNTDAISQGLLALFDRVIERDLKQMKLASECGD